MNNYMKKLIKYLIRKQNEKNERIQYERKIKNQINNVKGKVVIIPGTPTHTNLGDSAIVLAQKKFLQSCGVNENDIIEITFEEYYKYRELLKKIIKKDYLIASLGGGNMGNQWINEETFRYDLLEDFEENPVIIFPQTIHFVNTEKSSAENAKKESIIHYERKDKLIIVARETTSYEMMKSLYSNPRILLTPDVVLSTNKSDYGAKKAERKGVLLCIRNDAEKSITDSGWEKLKKELRDMGNDYTLTDMHSEINVTSDNRLDMVRRKMQEFCEAKLVVTDRLHGMIFAAITETPCIVLSNYNHKVYGSYQWIKDLPYIMYSNNIEEAIENIPKMLNGPDDGHKYDEEKMEVYFSDLKTEIAEYSLHGLK